MDEIMHPSGLHSLHLRLQIYLTCVFTDALQRPLQTRDARTALLPLPVGQGTPATLTRKQDGIWHSRGCRGSWVCGVLPRILSGGVGHVGVSFPETEDAATGRDLLAFYFCRNKMINLVTLKQHKCIIVQEARSWTWLSLG